MLFFVPFFIASYLFLFIPRFTVPLVWIVSLFWDLFSVQPLGSTAIFLFAFLTVLQLYSNKFNAGNQFFLFLILVVFVTAWAVVFRVPFVILYVFSFAVCFFLLSLFIRSKRENLQRTIEIK